MLAVSLRKPDKGTIEMTSDASDNPYTSEYPQNFNIDPEIKKLIAHYYEQVDTQGKHVEYSECWTEDGVLIVPNGKEFRGREGTYSQHRVSSKVADTLEQLKIYTLECGVEYRSVCIAQKKSSPLVTTRRKWSS
jgi:hypothetical protein